MEEDKHGGSQLFLFTIGAVDCGIVFQMKERWFKIGRKPHIGCVCSVVNPLSPSTPSPMPPRMRMTSMPTGSIETGNKLGKRPVIRQSQVYRETMSGNAVKSLLGHEDILWDTEQQEGVFRGMTVYKLEAGLPGTYQAAGGEAGWTFSTGSRGIQQPPHTLAGHEAVDAYPAPGCQCTCDGCGTVTRTFMHCEDCQEPNLFDLCTRCYEGLVLHRGRPLDLANLRKMQRAHPLHDFTKHAMAQVCPAI